MSDHEIFFDVGERIAKLRGKLTQAGFAQRIGVSRSSVEGWEAGKRLPDGSSLLRMREAFGADINVLLTGQSGGVAPRLRPDQEELLANYDKANSDGRERIRQIAATTAQSPKRREAKTSIEITHNNGQVVEGGLKVEGGQYFGGPPPGRSK